MVIIISLGGSFLTKYHSKIAALARLIHNSREKFVIVCGGGEISRAYIKFAASTGLKTLDQHIAGLKATQLNAEVIAKALGGRFYDKDPAKIKPKAKITVLGGFRPGWTTDVSAAYAAVACGSKTLFNLSKENGVYDKDPNKFNDAKLLKSISFENFFKLTVNRRKPGMNFIFDPQACTLCREHGIKVLVTSKIDDIVTYLEGKPISGTLIE
jgi:uridylate kinase